MFKVNNKETIRWYFHFISLLIFNEIRNVAIENTIPLAVIQARIKIGMPITEI